jgi:hypothetical protein
VSFDWTKHRRPDNKFIEFNEPGDQVTGTIVGIREHVFDQTKGPIPLLDMEPRDGGEQVTLSCSATNLRSQLAELQPQITDELRVVFVRSEKLPGRPQPLKIFEINHREGPRTAPAPDVADAVEDAGDYGDVGTEPF